MFEYKPRKGHVRLCFRYYSSGFGGGVLSQTISSDVIGNCSCNCSFLIIITWTI